MEKKFKVDSMNPFGSNGAKTYFTFEEAKIAFRKRFESKPEEIAHITDHIKEYANEHYAQNTPKAFEQLIEIITKLATDPTYPQNIDDVVLDDFEDDNIEFYMDSYTKAIYCYVNNDEYDGKFPLAEINVINMDDPDEEYFFFLTEKRDCMCWSWNYSLSPISDDDDDQDDFDFLDDDFDDEDVDDEE